MGMSFELYCYKAGITLFRVEEIEQDYSYTSVSDDERSSLEQNVEVVTDEFGLAYEGLKHYKTD